MRVPIGVPGGGVWGRVQVGGGGWFSCGKQGKGDTGWGGHGGGGGLGTGKGTGQSMRTRLSKLPFSKLPSGVARVRLADLNGTKWTSLSQNPVRNKVILTKMVILTILGQFGPVHFPTVPRPRPGPTLGVPPWSHFFASKNYHDFEASSLGIWCSEGHLAQFDLSLNKSDPIPFSFDFLTFTTVVA